MAYNPGKIRAQQQEFLLLSRPRQSYTEGCHRYIFFNRSYTRNVTNIETGHDEI